MALNTHTIRKDLMQQSRVATLPRVMFDYKLLTWTNRREIARIGKVLQHRQHDPATTKQRVEMERGTQEMVPTRVQGW
jgi:hypothetical protein